MQPCPVSSLREQSAWLPKTSWMLEGKRKGIGWLFSTISLGLPLYALPNTFSRFFVEDYSDCQGSRQQGPSSTGSKSFVYFLTDSCRFMQLHGFIPVFFLPFSSKGCCSAAALFLFPLPFSFSAFPALHWSASVQAYVLRASTLHFL